MEPEDRVVITLRSLPRKQFAAPAINRLRHLLKAALRIYGFRCEEIRPADIRDEVVTDEHRTRGAA